MKLVRFGERGRERPGVLDAQGRVRDLSARLGEIDATTLASGAIDAARAIDPASLPLVDGLPRFGACVGRIGKIIGIGLNYSDHAAESGMQVPPEPVVFMKATSSLSGPNDPIEIPRGSTKTDWEVELGVIIGRRAKYIDEANWRGYVAGYCVVNDLSEREFQLERAGQWDKGKGHDTFCPAGPWLVTADEVPDPQCLDLWLEVNGARMQSGNTRTMVYPVPHLVAYLSRFMTLEPGDLITTGTPPGVGMGRKPQRFLKPGDRVRAGVQGLGEQQQACVAALG